MEYPTDIKTLKEIDDAWQKFGDTYNQPKEMSADEENDQFQELGGDWWELDPSLKNLNVHTVIKPNQPQNAQI